MSVRPFLKWVGGKSCVLSEIEKFYPFSDEITKYAEPFVGAGAVLFDILNKHSLQKVYISDINHELINTYIIIRDNINELVQELLGLQNEFIPMSIENRKIYYQEMRDRFNILKKDKITSIEKAALMIFLNKTCFNGLYRLNRKGQFNAAFGYHENPLICDEENLYAVSEKLQNVEIVHGDYRKSIDFIDGHTFAYFDPPYRPTKYDKSPVAYTETLFNDRDQIKLAEFADELNKKGAKIVISNSFTKDKFFAKLYSSYNINYVEATRKIAGNVKGRGKVVDLLITNF